VEVADKPARVTVQQKSARRSGGVAERWAPRVGVMMNELGCAKVTTGGPKWSARAQVGSFPFSFFLFSLIVLNPNLNLNVSFSFESIIQIHTLMLE
jgi:hypothetical protein